MSTEARTILGSDSRASHHIGVPKTSEEERHMGSAWTVTGRFSLAVVMVAALVVAVGMAGQASALPQTGAGVGGTDVGGDCTISTPVTAFCPIDLVIPGDLLITSTGSINCSDAGVSTNSASPIDISVGGDMTMRAGSSIRAENLSGGGDGGKISLTVGGNFLMQGTSLT